MSKPHATFNGARWEVAPRSTEPEDIAAAHIAEKALNRDWVPGEVVALDKQSETRS